MKNVISEQEVLLKQTYQHFNDRDIDASLAMMHPEVDWPNGMEGGIEHGHEAVRNYWTRQWKELNPIVEPVGLHERQNGTLEVNVHQIVKDQSGNLVFDGMVRHIYSFEDGLIMTMDIEKDERIASLI